VTLSENGWTYHYRRMRLPTGDLIGRLCVVQLLDGTKVARWVNNGSKPGLWNLQIHWSKEIEMDRKIARAALVEGVSRARLDAQNRKPG
jgi:hypothetical protein